MRIVGSPQAWQRFKELEEQVIADQFAEALFDPSPAEDGHRIVEGVELALKFSLTPEQTLRICGSHLSSKERVEACSKFVQNWLMHSSVAELDRLSGEEVTQESLHDYEWCPKHHTDWALLLAVFLGTLTGAAVALDLAGVLL